MMASTRYLAISAVFFVTTLKVSGVFAGEPDLQENLHYPVGGREISETDSRKMREDRDLLARKEKARLQTEEVFDFDQAVDCSGD